MGRFEPIEHKHVTAHRVKNKAKTKFEPANTSGATSYIAGVINCAACGTGHALHGRSDEVRPDYNFVCRTCNIRNLCGTISFGSNN